MEKEKVKNLIIKIPSKVHKKLRIYCVSKEVKMKDVVSTILENFLSDK